MGRLGSWLEGECCLHWVDPGGGRRRASGEFERFEMDVLAELKCRDGRHWVVRQIEKRRDTGEPVAAADDDELRPLRAERIGWTSELHQRGVPYGLDEFNSDALGIYERVYGSLPEGPVETWNARFLEEYERVDPEVFEAEWQRARDALAKA